MYLIIPAPYLTTEPLLVVTIENCPQVFKCPQVGKGPEA